MAFDEANQLAFQAKVAPGGEPVTQEFLEKYASEAQKAVKRITGRFTCARCGTGYHDTFRPTKDSGVCDVCGSTEFKRRPDDNEQTVRTRMAEYRAKTAPILPFYEAKGLVRRVDGMGSVEEVGADIDAILDGTA